LLLLLAERAGNGDMALRQHLSRGVLEPPQTWLVITQHAAVVDAGTRMISRPPSLGWDGCVSDAGAKRVIVRCCCSVSRWRVWGNRETIAATGGCL
jgi:hypothetical protein